MRKPKPISLDDKAMFRQEPHYEPVGVCSYCMAPIEALQPGGDKPRHIESKLRVGECPQGLRQSDERLRSVPRRRNASRE